MISSIVLAVATLAAAGAQEIKVAAGTVEDQRASDTRMGGLTIELALSGGSLVDVKALRTRVKSAKDDLGAALLGLDRTGAPPGAHARLRAHYASPAG